MMYWPDHNAWMFGGWFVMLLIWVIPIALVSALGVYLAKTFRPARTPLEVLEEEYARGKISREEFMQKREDLLAKSK